MRRLREAGLILADVSLINPDKVDRKLNIIVEVELERDKLDLYANFQNMVLAAPEVTQCYVVTGEVDFILVVSVPDIQAYDDFARRVLYGDPNLRKFRSLISISRLKYTTAIELKENSNTPDT